MTSLLFVYVVFGHVLRILVILCQNAVSLQHFAAIDVINKSFIIVSTYRRCHVASEMGFKQDSPNPNPDSDSLMECTPLFTEFGCTMYLNLDSLIEYLLSDTYVVLLLASMDVSSEPWNFDDFPMESHKTWQNFLGKIVGSGHHC